MTPKSQTTPRSLVSQWEHRFSLHIQASPELATVPGVQALWKHVGWVWAVPAGSRGTCYGKKWPGGRSSGPVAATHSLSTHTYGSRRSAWHSAAV